MGDTELSGFSGKNQNMLFVGTEQLLETNWKQDHPAESGSSFLRNTGIHTGLYKKTKGCIF
jgi:hypothetical protein